MPLVMEGADVYSSGLKSEAAISVAFRIDQEPVVPLTLCFLIQASAVAILLQHVGTG